MGVFLKIFLAPEATPDVSPRAILEVSPKALAAVPFEVSSDVSSRVIPVFFSEILQRHLLEIPQRFLLELLQRFSTPRIRNRAPRVIPEVSHGILLAVPSKFTPVVFPRATSGASSRATPEYSSSTISRVFPAATSELFQAFCWGNQIVPP